MESMFLGGNFNAFVEFRWWQGDERKGDEDDRGKKWFKRRERAARAVAKGFASEQQP